MEAPKPIRLKIEVRKTKREPGRILGEVTQRAATPRSIVVRVRKCAPECWR
jgi:hypothetical protein